MSKWISRKLVVAILTPIIAGLLSRFGVDETTSAAVVATLGAYILGQSYVDSKAAEKG